jgi:site-specific DNA recombinase
MTDKHVRCAIYTRKSSEEGLEQSFNSLEAQRDACTAFALSQKHEGWIVLGSRYDDGGFSGGTMERPALEQLLRDIKAGKIDTVVVYKVDRLTRSLADFAKIIEVFDSHQVSFVSVTQHFNTTTSMGRLTLNVLLSFAQFEREITGERIRDKVAASKKKGMWMGGMVPLGYDCVDRRLIVNRAEANTVSGIFRHYLRLGCVTKLRELLEHNHTRSKLRTSVAGRTYGGAAYSRGALHHLLRNRIYLGEIVHRGQSFLGKHQAIVSRELWGQVAALLGKNNRAHRVGKSNSTPSLLRGKLFDVDGARFTPTHSVKRGKRYRYYTSQCVIRRAGKKPAIPRFPADELERTVMTQIRLLLQTPEKFVREINDSREKDEVAKRSKDLAIEWPQLENSKKHDFVTRILNRVTVGETAVYTDINRVKLLATLLGQSSETQFSSSTQKSERLELVCDLRVFKRGGETRVIFPDDGSNSARRPVPSIVKAVARARDWYDQIVGGKARSIGQLGAQAGLGPRHTRRILQCATLSPEVVETLVIGRHRPDLTVNQILKKLPLEWQEQKRQVLGVLCELPA